MSEVEVPRLDGWMSFAEVAKALKMTKQGVHRLVFDSASHRIDVQREVRAVGEQPILLLATSAVMREMRRRNISDLTGVGV